MSANQTFFEMYYNRPNSYTNATVPDTILNVPDNDLPKPTIYFKHSAPDKMSQASVQLKLNTEYVLIDDGDKFFAGWFMQDFTTLSIRRKDGSLAPDSKNLGIFIPDNNWTAVKGDSQVNLFNTSRPQSYYYPHNNPEKVVLEYGRR